MPNACRRGLYYGNMTDMKAAPEPNWTDQTIWTGDNLDIMRGMNSATVDLTYLDPPFNSNTDYTAPIDRKWDPNESGGLTTQIEGCLTIFRGAQSKPDLFQPEPNNEQQRV